MEKEKHNPYLPSELTPLGESKPEAVVKKKNRAMKQKTASALFVSIELEGECMLMNLRSWFREMGCCEYNTTSL